jgi:RNA polymerase sigma-70 factor (ECF subfamily)
LPAEDEPLTSRPNNSERLSDPRLAEACSQLVRRPSWDSTGDTEDAAQDACVRALEIAQPDAVKEPLRYVLRIARNLFIDRRRRRSREARLFEYGDEAALRAGDMINPERILAGKQALGGVLAAIDTLPPRCRQAFLLHRFDNLNYAAIGKEMGISVSMVEKHIAEAMMRLSRALKAREG